MLSLTPLPPLHWNGEGVDAKAPAEAGAFAFLYLAVWVSDSSGKPGARFGARTCNG